MNNTPSLVVLVKILRTLLFVLFEFSKFQKYLFLLFFFFIHFIPSYPRANDCPLCNVIVQLIIFCLKTLQFLEVSTVWMDVTFFCTFLQFIFHLLQFRSFFTGSTFPVCDCSLSFFYLIRSHKTRLS